MMDKRRYPRVKDDLGISISVVEHPDGSIQRNGKIMHLTENISKGGLRFRHEREMPIGSLVRIHVALKIPLKTITHLGRICWVGQTAGRNGCAMGVQFTETPPVDLLHWTNYVDHRLHAVAAES